MVLQFAIGAITLITLTLARPTATMGPAGLTAASSSAQVRGTAGAGGMDGAATAIGAGTDTVAPTDIVVATATAADTLAAIAVGTQVDIAVAMRLEAEQLRGPLVVAATAADTQVAAMQRAGADSTVAAASMAVADTGKA